jgi:BolA family transcriptional regulator, general stress-responsive regulator
MINSDDNRLSAIRKTLEKHFAPDFLEVRDDSAKHAGHAGAANGAGHYAINISAACFQGISRVEIHRSIYAALADFFPARIHALQIRHSGNRP